MARKFAAFDLEICKDIPEGTKDITSFRPLGITCAAVMGEGFPRPKLFYHGGGPLGTSEPQAGAMEIFEVRRMVDALLDLNDEGYLIVTHNGVSFDFDVLAEEAGDLYREDIQELAMNHVDTMLNWVAIKGYPIGLNTIAIGLGLPGKTQGMHGDLAPAMWRGTLEERMKTLEYVGQDAQTSYDVARLGEERGSVPWTAKSGKYNVLRLSSGKWMTAKECLEYTPRPDTSWMSDPKSIEDYFKWMEKK